MKDSLFEMLLNLFEKTLTQLKERHDTASEGDASNDENVESKLPFNGLAQSAMIKSARSSSMRVFNILEQMRLTKASYQFLMRMSTLGVISSEVLELILNQLIGSESRFVSLQETKWVIRNTMANDLDAAQLAFLDLVLYHKEDELLLH